MRQPCTTSRESMYCRIQAFFFVACRKIHRNASRFPKPAIPTTDRSFLQSYHLSQHCEFLLHIAENGHRNIRNVLPIGWKKCRIHHGFGCLYWCVAVYLTSQSGQPYLFFPLKLPSQDHNYSQRIHLYFCQRHAGYSRKPRYGRDP
jgi:hypothetical protein